MTHSKHPFKMKTDHIRTHLEWLNQHNLGTRRIAELSGVGRTTVMKIMSSQLHYVTVETAERLLSVRDIDLAPRCLVDGTDTSVRIAELRDHGYSLSLIARESEIPGLRVRYDMVTVETERRIKDYHAAQMELLLGE